MKWRIPNRLQFLWSKITARGNQSSSQADYFQNPATAMPPYRYRAVQHHPTADEKQYRATEQNYWQKQLRLAKELNVLTKWLNWITGIGTLVALFGLAFLWKTLEATEIAAVAARDAVTVARDTLNFTTENAYLDQRAWVGVTGAGNSTIEKGAPIQLEVIIQGSGKTPAVNVRIKAVWSIFPKKDEFYPWCGTNPSQAGASNSIIFPEQKTSISSIPQSVDPEVITRLETGEWVLYHYGTIDYEDVFDPPTAHCTTFCYLYSRDLKMPHPCGTYNKVTDTKCEAECQAPPSVSSVLK